MTSHLIIPDSHAHPDHNNDRFDWLSQLIIDLQPDVIVDIGDSACMPSLSSYDKGKRGFEGRRYQKDLAASYEAQDRLMTPLRRRKKKMPRRVKLIGNHEYRIQRAIDLDAAVLEGTISIDDLKYKDFGWEVVPYEGSSPGIITIDGISYAHYFTTGVMGRPQGGEHPAYNLLNKQFGSCTQGHTHTLDFAVRTRASDNKKIMGAVCGCYIDYFCDWAGNANHQWSRGVLFKQNIEDGQYDFEWIGIGSIKDAYGP